MMWPGLVNNLLYDLSDTKASQKSGQIRTARDWERQSKVQSILCNGNHKLGWKVVDYQEQYLAKK